MAAYYWGKIVMVVNSAISSPYFYKILNLIGSVHKNAPSISKVVVWDIGLNWFDLLILKLIKKVEVKKVPKFVSHWREGYTWKLYIYEKSPEIFVLHVDAGSVILKDITEIQNIIENDGVFCVNQGHSLKFQTPEDYWGIFGVDKALFEKEPIFHAGIFGYKRNTRFESVVNYAYEMGLEGYTLGYSKDESWRHKNLSNKYIRNCEKFRQDQTVLNLAYRKICGTPKFNSVDKFACTREDPTNETIIFNHRVLRYAEIPLIQYKNSIYKLFAYFFLIISHPKHFLNIYKNKGIFTRQ